MLGFIFILSAPIPLCAQDRQQPPSPAGAFTRSLVGTLAPVAAGAAMMADKDQSGVLMTALGVTIGPAGRR